MVYSTLMISELNDAALVRRIGCGGDCDR